MKDLKNNHFKNKAMKKLSVFVVAIIVMSCNSNLEQKKEIQTVKQDSVQQAGAAYACPMHPEVTSDKPGQCSKCGMDLEKK